ncbi:adenylate cyclase (ATP pyrophosphate-lyase) [Ruegeria lacuscaerulensis ITI-1157]|nr:adenylate cyclase (ATP pyrophosphate-lyase) [Ruegeria lacuscaerulensis ITI-1157]SHI63255.1 Adenylate and Guanylate cyclase catalytic domain-containing protein [Ruegeria lacuscaerulensis ITI-1157]
MWKYACDEFGSAENVASRLQLFANPLNIVAPEQTKYALIDESQISEPGPVDIKGRGVMDLIHVDSCFGALQTSRAF